MPYRAEVIDDNSNTCTYTVLTGNTFKKHFYSHRQSFREQVLSTFNNSVDPYLGFERFDR